MQYVITEGKRRLRRLTVEPRLISEAQRRNDKLKKRLSGKETINVVFLAVYDSMWKYDALFAAMLRHPRVRPVLIVCPADNLPAGERGELLRKTLAHFQSKGFDTQPACLDNGGLRILMARRRPILIWVSSKTGSSPSRAKAAQ